MTRRRTLRRLDATEADTLRVICDWLDVQQRMGRWGRLLYVRHQPPMMTSKRTDGKTKVIFKKVRESQLGAADLIVFKKCDSGGYGKDGFWHEHVVVLCIEVKSATGKQSDEQRKWQRKAEDQGLRYILARSLDDVTKEVK